MPETTSAATLKTGERLVIKTLHPPLDEYAAKVGCWRAVREEVLSGRMAETLLTPYFVGEINGEVVGSMGCYTPRDTRDVGLVEFVATAVEHRQKGIGSALLGRLIDWFTTGGGKALLLCTSNPIAGNMYEKHGFWYNVGDGMKYLAPNAHDFDQTYLAFDGKAHVRDATWGDLPRASVLYNHPEPRWAIKDYLTKSFQNTRFERHFLDLMKGAEDHKGAVAVLESPRLRVVGLATLQRLDSYYEQHVATLSFRVCPGYVAQATELLDAAAKRAGELSIGVLQIFVAAADVGQLELVESAGFSEEARLRNRLRGKDGWGDILIYSRHVSNAVAALWDVGDYYAGRNAWQRQRVASRASGA
jgi:GNAT superfamily N-acetyltransferase